MSEEKDASTKYSYDPFATGSSQSRWGRKGAESDVPIIAGYEILDRLGAGGMGAVWTARYVALNQLRAIKVLSPVLAADNRFLERFTQEARALGRLEHPNIVKVFDMNAVHQPPYIAMQFVEGQSLSQLLGSRSVPIGEAISYFEQVAEALDYAHNLGFVHRDIKPSNVMITHDGKALLIDFGVASALGADPGEGHTITGTTRYLSPEVCEGRMATRSSDIWGFAVMIYRTLTNELPFNDKSDDAVRRKIVLEPPARPKNVSRRVASFLLASLQKHPGARYESARDMVRDLKRASRTWVPNVNLENFEFNLSTFILGATGVLIALGLGAFGIGLLRQKPVKSIWPTEVTKFEGSPLSDESAGAGPDGVLGLDSGKPLSSPPAIGMKDLAGPWFADMGSQWADLTIRESGGSGFDGVLEVRDAQGIATMPIQGELAKDGKTVTYQEMPITKSVGSVSYTPGQFTGTISADRSQFSGKRGADQSVVWMKPIDLPMTTYTNAALEFTLGLPSGWQSAESTVNSSQLGQAQVVTFTPPGEEQSGGEAPADASGDSEIGFRVSLAASTENPLDKTLQDMAAALGPIDKPNLNTQDTIGGRNAVSISFRVQRANWVEQREIFGLLRGDSVVIVESWSPVDQAGTWSKVLARIRSNLQFTAQ